MASLYIKDRETAALAADVARRIGKTKTAAVREALQSFVHQLPDDPKRDIIAWMEEYRRLNPLGAPTGKVADKAFYDSLEEDGDEPA